MKKEKHTAYRVLMIALILLLALGAALLIWAVRNPILQQTTRSIAL